MLALPGPEHAFRYDGDFRVGEHAIILHQEGGKGRGTAWAVWDAAVTLTRWLEGCWPDVKAGLLKPGATILELGSGTGLVGLSAAACFTEAEVYLTDLELALPALRRNVDLNPKVRMVVDGLDAQLAGRIQVLACDWEHPETSDPRIRQQPFPLVILADCVWIESLVTPLLNTLSLVTQPGSQVLLAHQCRSQRVDEMFFTGLHKNFDVQKLPSDSHKIDLYLCQRR